MWLIARRLKPSWSRWSLWKRSLLMCVGLCLGIQLLVVCSLWREARLRQELGKNAQFVLGPSRLPAPLETSLRRWLGYKRMRLFAPVIELSLRKPTESDFQNAAQLTQLKSLDISLGTPTATGLGHLKGLRQLEALDLFEVTLDDQSLSGLSSWPNLRRIRLVGEMSPEALEPLKNCESLTELHLNDASSFDDGDNYDIGECPYTGPHLAVVAQIPHLKSLKIAGNIRDRELRSLANARELESLTVCRLQMETDTVNTLGELPHLEQLLVYQYYNFDRLKLQPLVGFPALKVFSINNCQLSSDFVASLAKLPMLESLQVNSCEIGENAAGLADLPKLKVLDLCGTDVQLSQLRKNGYVFEWAVLLFIDELMYPVSGTAIPRDTKPADHFHSPVWHNFSPTYGAGLKW